MPYRVIQWATGNTGQRALREVIREPSYELAGVLVYDPAKDGVDAGDLCGEPATGIVATTDRDAVLALDGDAASTCRAQPVAVKRAGLGEHELVADIVALLERGINIVTTCTDLFARGARLSRRIARSCRTLARRGMPRCGQVEDHPGFITETLMMALLSVQRDVELIEIEEFGDLSRRPSRHMVMEQMGFGSPLEEFNPDRRKNHLFGEYQPALTVLADAAGFDIDEWTAEGGVAAAREDLQIAAGEIKAGTAAAQRIIIHGRSGGRDRIRFIQYGFVVMDLEPDWDLDELLARLVPRRSTSPTRAS